MTRMSAGGYRDYWKVLGLQRGADGAAAGQLPAGAVGAGEGAEARQGRRAAAVGVIWKFRSTFRPGNYIWSFSYGFGVVVRDI